MISVFSVCEADDVAAKRWVRGYWGSDDACSEGLTPKPLSGVMEQLLCCASSGQPGCNAPGAAPPAVKCFQTGTTFSSGTCAGRSTSYSVCAVNQSRANEKAAAVLSDGGATSSAFDCVSAITSWCNSVLGASVSLATPA